MLKRPHLIALGLVVLLTLIVLNLPHHATNQIKLAIGSLFLPLFGLSKSSQQIIGHASDTLLPRSELLRQNEQLRRANQELQFRATQAEAVQRENDQFRALFGWQKQSLWKVRLASVIARDPANWWHIIRIDLGTRDGMRPDLPVITSAGLVGKISTVGLTDSQVVLIGNPDCKVAAIVEKPGERNGESGVITGVSSPLDNTLVTLSFLSSNSSLKPGEFVRTWGEGKIFPPGIPIGQVVEDSHLSELGYTEARVKLAADLGALEEVWVIIQ
ncbi:MAG TPA: rod shape-determining protein MreC [Verrucomicrobiae bacterium]|jgi:rod shape-determining protein MreC|nr:rod shape-determining protein MreC [Verrucomicrobiae bacterium]